ncbi:MAG: hypothetical protein U0547_13490 [Dehalococcoidia bacterium]
MATIRRTLLIEAPVGGVYTLARSFEQLPAFVPGVVAATGDAMEARIPAGGRTLACRFLLEEAVEGASLRFATEGEAPERIEATFVPVLGDATWSTWTLEFPCLDAKEAAPVQAAIARAVSDALTAFRDEAERRAHAARGEA